MWARTGEVTRSRLITSSAHRSSAQRIRHGPRRRSARSLGKPPKRSGQDSLCGACYCRTIRSDLPRAFFHMRRTDSQSQHGWARQIWSALGPGLITGAADDDPSGIATYSQAGAQYGYALTWTMLLTLPFMAAIQSISACIGWQTGKGLAKSLAMRFPPPVVRALVALLVTANTINVAADLAAMGEALRLAISGPAVLYALIFGVACLVAQTLVPYHRYAG